jgi:hypothetical protein
VIVDNAFKTILQERGSEIDEQTERKVHQSKIGQDVMVNKNRTLI